LGIYGVLGPYLRNAKEGYITEWSCGTKSVGRVVGKSWTGGQNEERENVYMKMEGMKWKGENYSEVVGGDFE